MDSLVEGLQSQLYASLVKDKNHQQQLRETTDPFLLKKRLEVFHEEEKRTRMRELAVEAYSQILETQKGSVGKKFRFEPVGDFPEKEYWGCDAYGYGWNLLGQALPVALSGFRLPLEDRVIRCLCPLLRYLSSCFEKGDPLTRFFHMSVAQMQESISLGVSDMDEVDTETITAEEEAMMQDEVAFPGSLVHLVRKRLAPTRNAYLLKKIEEAVLEGVCRLYNKKGDTEAPQTIGWRLGENLRFLYEHKKIPLPSRILERIEWIESRQWSEEEVWQAVAFLPRSSSEKVYESFHETDHPQFSPLAPQTQLLWKTKTFRHVLEYVYFWLLLDYVEDKEEAFRRVRAVQQWTSVEVQGMMRKAQHEFLERRLETLVGERLDANPLYRWALLTATGTTDTGVVADAGTTGTDATTMHEKLCVEVPYDPVTSHVLSVVLNRLRQRVVTSESMQRLCRWVSNKDVTRLDFCRYYAVRRNMAMWDEVFEGVKAEARSVVQKKFFRVLYPKKTSLREAFLGARVQSPEIVLQRMEKELSGVFLEFLKTKEGAPALLARLLYNSCFPQDVFCPFSRKIAWTTTKRDVFFSKVLKHW